jgi:hypothetical protein
MKLTLSEWVSCLEQWVEALNVDCPMCVPDHLLRDPSGDWLHKLRFWKERNSWLRVSFLNRKRIFEFAQLNLSKLKISEATLTYILEEMLGESTTDGKRKRKDDRAVVLLSTALRLFASPLPTRILERIGGMNVPLSLREYNVSMSSAIARREEAKDHRVAAQAAHREFQSQSALATAALKKSKEIEDAFFDSLQIGEDTESSKKQRTSSPEKEMCAISDDEVSVPHSIHPSPVSYY